MSGHTLCSAITDQVTYSRLTTPAAQRAQVRLSAGMRVLV